MPDKITSKNLSYDQSLPPFLARLRGQQAIDAESADPNLAARRRAAKVRSASEEAEDAPVVVDEDGNVVQLKAGELGDEDAEQQQGKDGADTAAEKKDEPAAEKEKTAGIGAAKKRKVGKVIGADEDDEAGGVDAAIAKAVKATRKLADEPKKEPSKAASADKPTGKSGKKKAKKIKLSFGDEEEG